MLTVIKKNLVLFGILGLLVGLAFCAVVYQTINGLSVTGLTDVVPWGLYVVNFTFCLGLGAGILIFLAMISGEEEIPYGYKLFLSLTAFLSLSLAGIFILMDLGRLDRFYYMVIYAQLKSPLFWDFVSLNALIGVSVAFCFVILRQIFLTQGLRKDASRVEAFLSKILTVKKDFSFGDLYKKKGRWIVVCVVVGMYLLTTELFAGMKARPQWHTPLLSLNFLVSTILSGFAAVILLGSFYANNLSGKLKKMFFASDKFLLILLVADLAIIFVKYGIDNINPLIPRIENLFPFSLLLFLILGNIIPIYLISVRKRRGQDLNLHISLLILVGVVLKRADIIIPGYFHRWLPFATEASYIPSLTESFIFLGIYSAGIIAMSIIFFFIGILTESRIP